MASTENGEQKDNAKEQIKHSVSSNSIQLREFIPIYIPTTERGSLDQDRRKKRFLDFLKAHPSKDWYLKSGFVGRLSPFSFLRRSARQANGASPPDPAPGGQWRRFRVPFVRKINWEALIKYCKNWAKHPMNMALLLWLFFVAICLVILFLFMTGLLNDAIPSSSQRKRWNEIVNQILNALFTIMCLYQHPRLFHHFVLLCRWRPCDAVELRKVYCKNGAPRPHERAHMMAVVLLLHITCFSQYGYCALYWAYSSHTRPDWAQILFIALGIAAPVVAFLYTVFGPLGRKYEYELDEESQDHVALTTRPDESEMKTYNGRVIVMRPEWVGGLFNCWDDLTVAYLSFFCTVCVFGWNMERLGFGNMYVHIITFILLCIAPFWVFNVAALKIDDDTVKYMVGITGIVLCFFGLLYGGFWRIQMRKRFKLPANPFCCGYPAVTDFMQWFFCWSCSLAQEVRTGNFYEIEEDSFYSRERVEDSQPVLVPLPRENGAGPVIKSSLDSAVRSQSSRAKSNDTGSTNSPDLTADGNPHSSSNTIDGETGTSEGDHMMTPPLPPLIQIEDTQTLKS